MLTLRMLTMGEPTKLVSISGGEPNASIVEALELLLADAKLGRIRDMAYVTLCQDGMVGTQYLVDPLRSDIFRVLGGVEYLKHRVITESVEPT